LKAPSSEPPGLSLMSLPPLPTCQLTSWPASYPSGQPANRSTDQLIVSPCHRAHVPPGLSHQPIQYFHTITMAAVSSSQ
jgi:hypothetical protein